MTNVQDQIDSLRVLGSWPDMLSVEEAHELIKLAQFPNTVAYEQTGKIKISRLFKRTYALKGVHKGLKGRHYGFGHVNREFNKIAWQIDTFDGDTLVKSYIAVYICHQNDVPFGGTVGYIIPIDKESSLSEIMQMKKEMSSDLKGLTSRVLARLPDGIDTTLASETCTRLLKCSASIADTCNEYIEQLCNLRYRFNIADIFELSRVDSIIETTSKGNNT